MDNAECHKLIRRNSTKITRYDVCSIASKVYSKALSAENLHAAFRKTVIYPFDPSAISNECVKPNKQHQAVVIHEMYVHVIQI
jgi:hypothetical protein